MQRTLARFGYARLGKADKGTLRRFLGKTTGLSRAQLTRLVRQYRDTGRIVDRRGGPPARPFERRCTAADARLLADVDATLGQMAGPATREVMRREREVFGDERFLLSVLEGLLDLFPFAVMGFHADNASRRDAPAPSTSTARSPGCSPSCTPSSPSPAPATPTTTPSSMPAGPAGCRNANVVRRWLGQFGNRRTESEP